MNDFKTCSICKQEKHYSKFSLQRNVESSLRKRYCTTCDYRKREQKRKETLESAQLAKIEELTCNPLEICQNAFPHLFQLVQTLLKQQPFDKETAINGPPFIVPTPPGSVDS